MTFSVTSLFSPRLSIPNTSKSPLLLSKSRHLSLSVHASISTSFDLRTYWTSLSSEVESNLDTALSVRYPEKMYEAIRYSVFSGGAKWAPPVMCIAACELFGTPRAAALPTAAALEMLHAASHIHDDLPCMHAAPLRHGQPSTHAQYGDNVALLVWEGLFPLGFNHIVTKTPSDLVPREALLSVLKEIARAMGSTGMMAGQYLDLTGAASGGEAEVLLVLEKKFGEMAECSAVCGGMLGGAGDDDQVSLRRYGRSVGVLYELVADVLVQSNGQAGKMKSLASVVRTLGMGRALEIVEQLRNKAKNELQRFGDRYGDRVLPLYGLVDYGLQRGSVVESGGEAMEVTEAGVAAAAGSSSE